MSRCSKARARRRTVLDGMLFGVTRLLRAQSECGVDDSFFSDALETPPRVEAREHRGGWVLLHFYAHRGGEAVRALTRIDVDDGRIARLQNHFYDPELIAEVCGELGVPSRSNGYRWWLPAR